jgi:hypothetical protein
MLPGYFRIVLWNNTNVSTAGAATCTVKMRGWYINTSGVPVWIATGSVTTLYSNAGALTSGQNDAAGSTAFNNSGAANPLVGAELEVVANTAASPTGSISFYLQASVDASTFPDLVASTEPKGEKIYSFYFAAAGSQKDIIRID